MAKPIATFTAFTNSAPPWSLTSLDANFTSALNAFNDYSTYSNYLADTSGVANTITVNTPAGTAFAYTAGIQVQVKVAVTSTSTTVNVNVNSLGNQAVKNPDGSNPVVGQLVAGGVYSLTYDGTNFQIIGNTLGFTGFANPTATIGNVAVNGTATTAMRSDAAPALGTAAFANPTASLGLTAVNGTALQAMRADAAPALNQAIIPTWTGNHTFSPGSGVALTVNAVGGSAGINIAGPTGNTGWIGLQDGRAGNRIWGLMSGFTGAGIFEIRDITRGATVLSSDTAGAITISAPTAGDSLTISAVANQNALSLVGSSTNAQSFGAFIRAGTTSADYGLLVRNFANANIFKVQGDSTILGQGSVAGALVDMSPDSGTFTLTGAGFTAAVTSTATWYRIGKLVVLHFGTLSGTSNATSFTASGLPAAIQPATLNHHIAIADLTDNGNGNLGGKVSVAAGANTLTFALGVTNIVANTVDYLSTSFTNSGSKAVGNQCIIYSIQ